MNRRRFLKGAGAVSIVVAGGVVFRSYQQGIFTGRDSGIYEAWDNWNEENNSGPLALVRAGILASNPHNTQPWIFKVTDNRIELFADLKRHLGSFDPYRREMYLGLGCALENMSITAQTIGLTVDIKLSPGSLLSLGNSEEPKLVADINIREGRKIDNTLYQAIPNRHTNRGPYDTKRDIAINDFAQFEVVTDEEQSVRALIFRDKERHTLLGNTIVSATEQLIADQEMLHDSEKWMRHSWAEMKKHRSGISVDSAGLPPLTTNIAKIMPPMSEETNGQYWLNGTRDVQVATANFFGLIVVKDLYDIEQSLQAGRLWQNMHLHATSLGIAMQPLNQPVELVDRERQLNQEPATALALAKIIGHTEWKPTFSFRAGYALTKAKSSPRRKLENVIA